MTPDTNMPLQISRNGGGSSDKSGQQAQQPLQPWKAQMPAQINLALRLATQHQRNANGSDPRDVFSESSSYDSRNEGQIRHTDPNRTPRGAANRGNGFPGLRYRVGRTEDNDTNEMESDDVNDNETMSATSAGERVERQRWPRILNRSMITNKEFFEATDRSGISDSLQQVHDKRTDVQRERRSLADLESKLKQIRDEKTKVDHELHLLTLSCSMNGQAPPRKLVMNLYSKAQILKTECDSLESKYDELRSKLERKTARLEAHESGLLRNFASGAAESYANASGIMDRFADQAMTKGPRRPPMMRTGVEAKQQTGPRTPTWAAPVQTTGTLPVQSRRLINSTLVGITGDRPRSEHPLFEKLLQTVGELKVSKEELNELEFERDEIIHDLQSAILLERSRTGAAYNPIELQVALKDDYRSDNFTKSFAGHLAAADLEFLQGWYTKEEDLKAKILAKQQEVDRMREWCIKMDVLPKYMSFEEQESVLGAVLEKEQEADVIGADMDAAVDGACAERDHRRVLAHRGFPRLLTNPYHLLARPPTTAKLAVSRALKMPENHPAKPQAKEDSIKEFGIETILERFVVGKKPDFINRWMLQQLRMSSLEAVRLFMIMSDTLHIINLRKWQDDVVYHWSLDETNQRNNYHSLAESLETPDGRVSESLTLLDGHAKVETSLEI